MASRSSPVQVGPGSSSFTTVTAGTFSGQAITIVGTLWSWGQNSSGELGSSNVTDRSSPIQVGTAANWSTLWDCGQQKFAVAT